MLTQSEYAIRMMEIHGKCSLIDSLIAFRECRAPLKPRCLFGPSDEKNNLKFAQAALESDRQRFLDRYALVEPTKQDYLIELCQSVKRKMQTSESGRNVKFTKLDTTSRKRKLEKSSESMDQRMFKCSNVPKDVQSPCLVTRPELSCDEDDNKPVKQTQITDFWQSKKKLSPNHHKEVPSTRSDRRVEVTTG